MLNNAHLVGINGILSTTLRWKYVKDFNIASSREETFVQLWLDK